MQFLRSKKEAYLQKIDKDINFLFLKTIQLLGIHSEDLTFTAFVTQNPHYTKHHDYNMIIHSYSEFLQESLIVLTSEFYEEVYSSRYLHYRFLFSSAYFNSLHKYALELENYINVAKENHLSNAVGLLTSEDCLPESATH